MHLTTALRRAAQAATNGSSTNGRLRSLALSVHFRQPDFGMKKYEILSRATAFLLAVDPLDPGSPMDSGPYDHLERSELHLEAQKLRQRYAYEPAGGPPRPVQELGWLEFCPTKFRPEVHCVASSHVLAPWLWKNYYPQDWLTQVRAEHCAYSLEVFDPERPKEALAKFALNPCPIHDPSGRDLALIHLKQEETALKHLTDLGVQIHRLRDHDNHFIKGEELTFDGFIVAEPNSADQESFANESQVGPSEDTRVFYPYSDTGSLSFASKDRFLASTPSPLPEGVCGGPTLDRGGFVCGVVEGIIPKDHDDKRLAGAASFLPAFIVEQFVEYAERNMLEQIVPEKLFKKVVDMKEGKPLSAQNPEYPLGSESSDDSEVEMAFEDLVSSMKKSVTMEQADAILGTIAREREEVLRILQEEGGDVDEVIARVRNETRKTQQKILEEDAQVTPDPEKQTST